MSFDINFSFSENPDFAFPLMCPKCEQQQTKPLGELRQNPEFTCTGCGTVVRVDMGELDAALAGLKDL